MLTHSAVYMSFGKPKCAESSPCRRPDLSSAYLEHWEQEDRTTTVALTNRGLRDEESRRPHRQGWQASFDNLDRVLAA
jgi:hypothetical protein